MKTIPLSEAKARLSRLVDDVARRDERVLITRNGRAAAVLMSADELEGLEETLAIMSDPDLMAQIRRNVQAFDRGTAMVYELDDFDENFELKPGRKPRRVSVIRRGERRKAAAKR